MKTACSQRSQRRCVAEVTINAELLLGSPDSARLFYAHNVRNESDFFSLDAACHK